MCQRRQKMERLTTIVQTYYVKPVGLYEIQKFLYSTLCAILYCATVNYLVLPLPWFLQPASAPIGGEILN